jgi:hypothetical protein
VRSDIADVSSKRCSLLEGIVPWQRWEWWVLIGLFVLTLSTRWPLRVTSLEEFDSVNYALALQEFSVLKRQPHPPGYLFFIGTARLAYLWTADVVSALTAVQAISGVLSVMLFYGLLRLCMPPAWALGSTLMYTFSAQVWFQHVRPLEDAYAFLWMLGVVYALVRSLYGDTRWWIGGMILLGLGMGVKQVLPVFLVGLIVHTLWNCVSRRRFHTILLGILGSLIATLTWFVPLSIHAGSTKAYIALALSQMAYQREHEALIFHMEPFRIYSQLWTTFVLIWGYKGLALPMWGLVVLGASQVVRRHLPLRWLLWLVVPTLLIRFFLLGYWPRFTLYYLPFLIPLAVVGFSMLGRGCVRLIRRVGLPFVQYSNSPVPNLRPLWFIIPGIALLVGWIAPQEQYIGSTLRILHSEPSPVVRAVQYLRQHYEPAATVILSDNALISRHLEYYAARAGFFSIYEPYLHAGNLDVLNGVQHVLKIRGEPVPPPSAYPLETWLLKVPHWRDLSLFDDFLHVVLYELRGPFALFSAWHGPESDPTRVVRWSKPEGSQIWILRVPSQGCFIRLQGEIPVLPSWPSPPPTIIRINGALAYELRDYRIDVSFRIQPTEIMADRAVIAIQPGCTFTPAEVGESNDWRRLGCFRLTDITVQP